MPNLTALQSKQSVHRADYAAVGVGDDPDAGLVARFDGITKLCQSGFERFDRLSPGPGRGDGRLGRGQIDAGALRPLSRPRRHRRHWTLGILAMGRDEPCCDIVKTPSAQNFQHRFMMPAKRRLFDIPLAVLKNPGYSLRSDPAPSVPQGATFSVDNLDVSQHEMGVIGFCFFGAGAGAGARLDVRNNKIGPLAGRVHFAPHGMDCLQQRFVRVILIRIHTQMVKRCDRLRSVAQQFHVAQRAGHIRRD